MDSNEYMRQSAVTRAEASTALDRIDPVMVDLLHAGMGMQTESAEFTDMLKKHVFYGKPLDKVNLREELGDQLWYISVACEILECTFEDIMSVNIDKLRARYPDGFTEYDAENRDLETERKILEQ